MSDHVVIYKKHRYECTRCGARRIDAMTFATSECPGPKAQPDPASESADWEMIAKIAATIAESRSHEFSNEETAMAVLITIANGGGDD